MTPHPDDVSAVEMQISVSSLADSPRMIAQAVITAIDIARANRLSAEVRKLVKELCDTRSMYGDSHSNFGNQARRAADMLLSLSAQVEAANARAAKAEVAVERLRHPPEREENILNGDLL